MQFLLARLISNLLLFAQTNSHQENQQANDHYYEYDRHDCVYPLLLEICFHWLDVPQLVEEAFRCETKSLVPKEISLEVDAPSVYESRVTGRVALHQSRKVNFDRCIL